MIADLHIHTKASDGKYSSKEIVQMSLSEKIDVIAITDHDTTEGIDNALKESKKSNIKVVPGIELSTLYNGNSVHILGYFNGMNYLNSCFQKFLKEIRDYRLYRAELILERLNTLYNIKLDFHKIMNETNGVLARPHIADAIINCGYNYSYEYIFNTFIGNNCPAYVPNKDISISEGIERLRDAGALVVLAHPKLLKDGILDDVLSFNFDGIEAIYYLNSEKETKEFIDLANKKHLVITAGSDFHGSVKEEGTHSPNIGAVYLENNYVNVFLNKLRLK
ncbi:MAG: hydrolase [Clostridiaceae bacterium]|jgi:predicted metal-dependent phosphoesterase TrpH|nr:hydrolase [Clostridiaceae bacterium]